MDILTNTSSCPLIGKIFPPEGNKWEYAKGLSITNCHFKSFKLLIISMGRFHEKKVAVLLDFVQMRGGGCPNFLSTFHKLYILGQFGDGEGGEDPCPKFLANLH